MKRRDFLRGSAAATLGGGSLVGLFAKAIEGPALPEVEADQPVSQRAIKGTNFYINGVPLRVVSVEAPYTGVHEVDVSDLESISHRYTPSDYGQVAVTAIFEENAFSAVNELLVRGRAGNCRLLVDGTVAEFSAYVRDMVNSVAVDSEIEMVISLAISGPVRVSA